ncbi:hypothetical protein GHT06_015265 [Daphnia sinensis]|uniref:Uncharacterized protein n=1 Tax=Daphnia sinensis TaxID=1820382 RepID=A0AAD5PUH6_9CRUS|nr:hypothetical protein GHT06_015265 [Daphnia sinensis]
MNELPPEPLYLIIIKYPLGSAAVTVPSVIKNIVPRNNESLDINIRQNARIQYLEDAAIRHENELIRIIQSMQCDQRRAKHAQAVSTGWSAAAQLGLRQCEHHPSLYPPPKKQVSEPLPIDSRILKSTPSSYYSSLSSYSSLALVTLLDFVA